jgi:hypothetical protein
MAPLTNQPQTLVAPDPTAAAQKDQQAVKKPQDEHPASIEKQRGGKIASASGVPLPRAEPKAAEAIPVEAVPLPQARPRPRHHR